VERKESIWHLEIRWCTGGLLKQRGTFVISHLPVEERFSLAAQISERLFLVFLIF